MTANESITKKIQDQIDHNPLIRDPSKISISLEREGPIFRKNNYIVVKGKVSNKVEYDKVDKIVSESSGGNEVINNLKITSSSI